MDKVDPAAVTVDTIYELLEKYGVNMEHEDLPREFK